MSKELVSNLKELRSHLVLNGHQEYGFSVETLDAAIAALSAPQAETCERGAIVNDGSPYHPPQIYIDDHPALPWTRKDGSTTPERGDVVDRRKSADGGGPLWRRFQSATVYGRRSGDAARWTAPVQETEQTQEFGTWLDWFREQTKGETLDWYREGDQKLRFIFASFMAEFDRRSASK